MLDTAHKRVALEGLEQSRDMETWCSMTDGRE